ncbi:Gfo/Idh/MocA family protein [Opitutus terrae]|uniref:Oxidoreductase domain protein n=1 Tax=Opitutus terrae (strain DSM 11246 / JCM 15787 / PB90-1) TaxID=452637 RepID=B1ZNV9_OPITP|nr:Gfo/Idh/MocA family oxidoreductase [Opitutus terrae]ACB75479.1 oxidoreductase domain protein [Opitutus terrae PB90-1]
MNTPITRRAFVRNTAALAAVAALPRRLRAHSAGDKLNIAAIGIGGQGSADLRAVAMENIVALCDVDADYAAHAFAEYPQARRYTDFREMFDREKDLDAVVVATPDHLHAVVTMAALQHGKHVYCEKPLTRTVHEARAIAQAAAKAKVATQMGNQGMAFAGNRQLDEWIQSGAIGAVREVHVWSDRPTQRGKMPLWWPQGVERPTDTPPVPETLNWDLWLGPAPHRPYHPAYAPFRWRGWWDFGSGGLGDMGIHNLAPVFSALKLGAPETVSASSTALVDDSVPLASLVHYRFPARGDLPPVTLHWYDGGLLPARPDELEAGGELDPEDGILFVGDEGKILVEGWGGEHPRILGRNGDQPYRRPPSDETAHARHAAEWIAACKNGSPTRSDFRFAGPLTEAVLLGAACVRNGGRKLVWDSASMTFTNDPRANQYLHYTYRDGWRL